MGQEHMDAQNWSMKTFTNIIVYIQSAFKKQIKATSTKASHWPMFHLWARSGTAQNHFTSTIYFQVSFEPAFWEINFENQKRCL